MAKKLITHIDRDSASPSSKVDINALEASLGAFTTDSENRTVWIDGMPYGNAYISNNSNEDPIHSEVFNDFDRENGNKAFGDYSHAEGTGTKTFSKGSHAEGINTTAGLRGFSFAVRDIRDNGGLRLWKSCAELDTNNYLVFNCTNEENLINQEISTYYSNCSTLSVLNGKVYADCLEIKIIDAELKLKLAKDYIKRGINPFADKFYEVNQYSNFLIWSSENPDAGTIDIGFGAHAEGINTVACGTNAHAEGTDTLSAESAHSEGVKTRAFGVAAHAEGNNTIANSNNSHAEGQSTFAGGYNSHSEGRKTIADGNQAHAEGIGTKAKADNSHTEGNNTIAVSNSAHAEGIGTVAGDNSSGRGKGSHTEGIGTITKNDGEHAEGVYNFSSIEDNFISSIGIGSSDDDRKNAISINKNGLIYITKTVESINDILTEYNPCNYNGKSIESDSISLQRILAEFSQSMINVTYAELKNYVENKNLIPGKFYRITDYNTNVVSEITNTHNITSAGHEFDIVVLAMSVDRLNDNAYAVYKNVSNGNLNENVQALENGKIICTDGSDLLSVNKYIYNKENSLYENNEVININKFIETQAAGNIEFVNYTDESKTTTQTFLVKSAKELNNKFLTITDDTGKKYIYNYPQLENIKYNTLESKSNIFDNYNINSFIEIDKVKSVNEYDFNLYISSVTLKCTANLRFSINGSSKTTTATMPAEITLTRYGLGTMLRISKVICSQNGGGNEAFKEYIINYLKTYNYNKFPAFYSFSTNAEITNKNGETLNTSQTNFNNLVNSMFSVSNLSIDRDNYSASAVLEYNGSNSKFGNFNIGANYTKLNTTTTNNVGSYTNINIAFSNITACKDVNLLVNPNDYGQTRSYTFIFSDSPNIIFPKLTQIVNNLPEFITTESINAANSYYTDLDNDSKNPINLLSWKLKYNIENSIIQDSTKINGYYTYFDRLLADSHNTLMYLDTVKFNIDFYTNYNSNRSDWNVILPENSGVFDEMNFRNYRYRLNQIIPQKDQTTKDQTDTTTDETTSTSTEYTILSNKIYPLSKTDETYFATLCKTDKTEILKTSDITIRDYNTCYFNWYLNNYIIMSNICAPKIINYKDEFGFIDNDDVSNWLILKPENTLFYYGNLYLQIKHYGENTKNYVVMQTYDNKVISQLSSSDYKTNTGVNSIDYITYDGLQYFLIKGYENYKYTFDLSAKQENSQIYSNEIVKNEIYNKFGIEITDDDKYYVYVALSYLENGDYGDKINIDSSNKDKLNDSNLILEEQYIIASVYYDEIDDNYNIKTINDKKCIFTVKADKISELTITHTKKLIPNFNVDTVVPTISSLDIIYTDAESVSYNNNEYSLQCTKTLETTPKNFKYNVFKYKYLTYDDNIYTIYKNDSIKDHCLISNPFTDENTFSVILKTLNVSNIDSSSYITNDNILSYSKFVKVYAVYNNDNQQIELVEDISYSNMYKYTYLEILHDISNAYEKIEYNIPYYFGRGNIYGLVDEYNNSFGYDASNIMYLGNDKKYHYTFCINSNGVEDNAIRYGYIRNNKFSTTNYSENTGGIFDNIIINCTNTTNNSNLIAVNNDFSEIRKLQITGDSSIEISNSKFSNIENTTFYPKSTAKSIRIQDSIFSSIINGNIYNDTYIGAVLRNIDNTNEYNDTQNSVNPIFALSNFRIFDSNNCSEVINSGLFNVSLSITGNDSPYTTSIEPLNSTFTAKRRVGVVDKDEWNYHYNTSEIKYTITITKPEDVDNIAFKLVDKKYLDLGYLQGSTYFFHGWNRYDNNPGVHLKFKPTVTVRGAFDGEYSFYYDQVAFNGKEETEYYNTFVSKISLDISKLTKNENTSIYTFNGNNYFVLTDNSNSLTIEIKLPKVTNGSFYAGCQNKRKTTRHNIKLSNVLFFPMSNTKALPFDIPTERNAVKLYDGQSEDTIVTADEKIDYSIKYDTGVSTLKIPVFTKTESGNNSLVAVCTDGLVIKAGSNKYAVTTPTGSAIYTDYFGKFGTELNTVSHFIPNK